MTKLRFISLLAEDYCRNNGLELTVPNIIIALVALNYIDIDAQHQMHPTGGNVRDLQAVSTPENSATSQADSTPPTSG